MIATFVLAMAMQAGATGESLQRDRLAACLDLARRDSAAAIVEAGEWEREILSGSRVLPLQCLGTAYANRNMWDAARAAFDRAAGELDGDPAADRRMIAALRAQAGNAALAGGVAETALVDFDRGLTALAGVADAEVESAALLVDRARALVTLARTDDAMEALREAQERNPNDLDSFLLAATLARRSGDLEAARDDIGIAYMLAPEDLSVLLEAGVISALSGNDAAAIEVFTAISEAAPGTPIAEDARAYLAQLEAAGPAASTAAPPSGAPGR